MTRLEIVNQMLAVLGIAPLTGQDEQHPSFIEANAVLTSEDTKMQTRGWWFNRIEVLLSQTTEGHVVIPSGAIAVDPTNEGSKLVAVGGKLYDPVNNTFNIGQEVKCDVTMQRIISDLPPIAALALQDCAVHRYFLNKDGSNPRLTELRNEKRTSWSALKKQQLARSDVNVYDNPRVAAIVDLRNIARGNRQKPWLPGGKDL